MTSLSARQASSTAPDEACPRQIVPQPRVDLATPLHRYRTVIAECVDQRCLEMLCWRDGSMHT